MQLCVIVQFVRIKTSWEFENIFEITAQILKEYISTKFKFSIRFIKCYEQEPYLSVQIH